MGDRTVEATVDGNTPGQAEAFVYTAQATGTVNQAAVYLDTSNTATTVRVGVYADDGSNAPGSLLAEGTITNPTNAAWNMASLPSVNLTAGSMYWIALLGPAGGGTVHYRDTSSGSTDYVSQQTNLTSLPGTWTSGQGYINSPMSAYLVEAGTSQGYTYDPVGNRTSLTQGSTTNYAYDKADRILSAGSTGYTVDNAGNLVARGSDSFAYDQANRLKSATVAGTTTAYVYDGDGKRASQTTGGTTTAYVYDVNASLPNVLADGTLKYVYGLGLAYAVDTSGNVQVYHDDGLGSVRAITNGSGTLTQTYQTDPFGVSTQTQGTSGQPFQFTGQQRDGTGLYFLRARIYDPTIGRFLSRDPVFGAVSDPLSLNRFAYALDAPTTLTDPTGLSSTNGGDPPASAGSLAKADNECFSTLGGSLDFYGVNARCAGIESDDLAVAFLEGPQGELLAIVVYQIPH